MKKSVWQRFLTLFLAGLMIAIFSSVLNADDRTLGRKRPKPGEGSDEQRLALVIGNGDYQSSPLRNPVNDASAMAKALGKVGFQVIKKTNLDQKGMKRAIDKFGKMLRQDGVALFYFAGHGIQTNGRNYLIPVDTSIEMEEDVEYEAVRADRVLAKMARAEPRINIVILDACRNNPFARSFRSGSEGLAHMDAPSGTLIAYATAPGSVASDGPGENGLYTQELIKTIKTPGLTIEDVFKRVRAGVRELSQKKQTPWESSSLVGNFYFKSKPVVGQQQQAVARIQPEQTGPRVVEESPLYGRVEVTSNVNAALFILAGQEYTAKAGYRITLDRIPVGSQTITARKKGYHNWQATIAVEDNSTTRLNIHMIKIAPSREGHEEKPESPAETATPKNIAEAFLSAYKAKNVAGMAKYCTAKNQKMMNAIALQGERHSRYSSIFKGWRWETVLAWDGKIGEVRYPSSSEAWVAFNDIKKTAEVVVVTLVLEDGRWRVEDIHSPTKRDFEKAKAEISESLFLANV